ncbi:MAG: ArsR family transcriptional regulator [Ilumatobacteraceae bacterium]
MMVPTSDPPAPLPDAPRPGVIVPPPVSAAQRSVLYAVRRRGQATVTDIAEMLDMTVSGARQHLTGLADNGLLQAGEPIREPGRKGRAERTFCIAPAAEALFPRAYGELTNELLGYVPPDAVTAAFERRRDHRIDNARARLATKRSFAAKVTELARILDEDGYLATVEPLEGGGHRIAERNCAIFAVAREHPQACSSELEFLRAALPEAEIERATHMMAGAHACSYEIRRRPRRVDR